MKKYILFFATISIISFNYGISQNVKLYKGRANYMYHPGTETYSYFEKDGERIKHGKYFFVGKLSGYADGTSNNTTLKITGYFKNGKAENLWILNWKGTQNGASMTYSLKIPYKDGLPNGKSNFNFIVKRGNKSGYRRSVCTFKDGKFVGDYLYKEGITGYTDPEYELKGKFTNDGYMTGTWTRIDKRQNDFWQNVTKEMENENVFNDFENGIKINDDKELIYLEDKDYIDLHYGSISRSEYNAFEKGFSIYKDDMNPIFEIAGYKRYIYITREEEIADLKKMNELKTKFNNENDTISVNKVVFCINIENANQILTKNNTHSFTVNDYISTKSHYQKALKIFPEDNYVKGKISLTDKKINDIIIKNFNSISFDINKQNYKDAIAKLDTMNKLSNEYPYLKIKAKYQSSEKKQKESIKNYLDETINEAEKYLIEIKSASAEQEINKATSFINLYSKYLEKDNRIIELENKLKDVKILEEKYIQITQKIAELEFSFKAPPDNNIELSSKKIKKLKKYYGENFTNFNRAITKEHISELLFPKDNIILEYLYFQNS